MSGMLSHRTLRVVKMSAHSFNTLSSLYGHLVHYPVYEQPRQRSILSYYKTRLITWRLSLLHVYTTCVLPSEIPTQSLCVRCACVSRPSTFVGYPVPDFTSTFCLPKMSSSIYISRVSTGSPRKNRKYTVRGMACRLVIYFLQYLGYCPVCVETYCLFACLALFASVNSGMSSLCRQCLC